MEPVLAQEWRWRTDAELADLCGEDGFIACDDGSRAGRRGMLLEEEMARG